MRTLLTFAALIIAASCMGREPQSIFVKNIVSGSDTISVKVYTLESPTNKIEFQKCLDESEEMLKFASQRDVVEFWTYILVTSRIRYYGDYESGWKIYVQDNNSWLAEHYSKFN